jgi:hypothetical protein
MKKLKTGRPNTKAKSKAGPQAAFKDQLQDLFNLLRAVD